MANIYDTFIVGYEQSEEDEPALSVVKYEDSGFKTVNVIRGIQAEDIYKMLNKKEGEFISMSALYNAVEEIYKKDNNIKEENK